MICGVPEYLLYESLLYASRTSSLQTYSTAALLLMSLNAHYKQIAQGVLSAESGTHECQSAGAIPTHPSQTDLILASKIATFYVFFQKRNYLGVLVLNLVSSS